MVTTKREITGSKKLVKTGPGVEAKESFHDERILTTTNRPRGYTMLPRAAPHIRKHEVKGRVYYCYVRGTDREIYLGSADIILKAVQDYRGRQFKEEQGHGNADNN